MIPGNMLRENSFMEPEVNICGDCKEEIATNIHGVTECNNPNCANYMHRMIKQNYTLNGKQVWDAV